MASPTASPLRALCLMTFGVAACFNPDSVEGSEGTDPDASSSSVGTNPTDPSGQSSTGSGVTSSETLNPGTDDSDTGTDDTETGDTGTDDTETGDTGTDDTETGDTGGARCGDGRVSDDEVCDDGINDGSYGGCLAGCQGRGPFCGDGRRSDREACDDGNTLVGDGCNNDCVASGSELWCELATDNDGADFASSIAVGPDDEVIASGQVRPADGSRLAWVQSLGSDGTFAWEQTWNAGPGLYASGAAVASRGGQVVLTGSSSVSAVTPTGAQEIFVRSYSPLGQLSWEQVGPPGSGSGVTMDELGNAFVVGISTPPAGDRDIWIRRYSVTGDPLWTELVDVNSGSDDLGVDVALRDGVLAVAGRWNFSSPWVGTFDLDGAASWAVAVAETQTAEAVMIGPAGDVILGARGGVFGEDVPSLWLRTFNAVGNGQSTQTDEDLTLRDACIDSEGNLIVVAGETLRKYTAMGDPLWTVDVGADIAPLSIGQACAVDSLDNIVVAGAAAAAVGDLIVCKYAP